MANEYFYPPVEPYTSGIMKVAEPHELYWEQCGNPQGEPVIFLHGGPGAGCSEHDRCFFDPEKFRIVLLDQRGSGRSRPVGDLTDNTMAATAGDIEQLRELLGIEQWHVFGGSYGSTLALYYAQQFPAACKSLVLRGIWLLRDEEIDWWLYRIRMIQPELWQTFAGFIPEAERGDLLEAYWQRLTGDDRELALIRMQPGPSRGWKRIISVMSNPGPTRCCSLVLSVFVTFRPTPCMVVMTSFAP
jgi:proline iminopeptidase